MKTDLTKLTYPTIHLNGSSKERLLDDVVEAAGAIRRAERALNEMAPNARDYYVEGPDAFAKANEQHRDRLERLASVLREVAAIQEHIHTGNRGRS